MAAFVLTVFSTAYAGWNMMNSMTEQCADPGRDIPRIYVAGMATVVASSILFCVSFFSVLPLNKLTGTLAGPFGLAIAGPVLKSFLCVMVSICCFGSMNGNCMGALNICASAAGTGDFPAYFAASETSKSGTSRNSLLAFTCWVSFLIITAASSKYFLNVQGLKAIMKFYTIGQFIFFALIAVALIMLRYSDPDATRPYSVSLCKCFTSVLHRLPCVVLQ